MSRKIVLITNLDVWLLTGKVKVPGVGNQSLYNTLLGYAEGGWDVHMLTTNMTLAGMPSIHKNVFIHRKPLRLYDLYRWLKGQARRVLGAVRPKAAPAPVDLQATAATFSTERMWRFSQIFRRVIGRRAVALAKRVGGVECIYGHEIMGALAGEEAARELGVPLITRFQGTELSQFLDRPEELLACKTHVAAAKLDADLIIMANDGTLGDKVLDFLGVPKDRYRFWMNGVVKDDVYRPDVDVAGIRRKLGIADNEVFILYAGRIFRWKRIDRHLEVFKRIRERFDRFKVAIIGDGSELEPARRMCAELGLDDRVAFLGAMPHTEVMDYQNACDVYVSFHDLTNLCNPAIESCVCGKCIVTTNIGGISDLLTDNVNAVVIPEQNNVEAISAGLLRVLKDPDERTRLAEGALQRGKELKTWAQRMQMETSEVQKVVARTGR